LANIQPHHQIRQAAPRLTDRTTSLNLAYHHNSTSKVTDVTDAPQVLNMARNSLIALPPEISCLTNLTELDVGRNQLTALPATLCSLSQLQVRVQTGVQLQRQQRQQQHQRQQQQQPLAAAATAGQLPALPASLYAAAVSQMQ
jgi:hypothetical protein